MRENIRQKVEIERGDWLVEEESWDFEEAIDGSWRQFKKHEEVSEEQQKLD